MAIWYLQYTMHHHSYTFTEKALSIPTVLNVPIWRRPQRYRCRPFITSSLLIHHYHLTSAGRWTPESMVPSKGVTKWQTGFSRFSTSAQDEFMRNDDKTDDHDTKMLKKVLMCGHQSLHWMYQALQMALFRRILSLQRSFKPLKFFHFGDTNLPLMVIKTTTRKTGLQKVFPWTDYNNSMLLL